MNIDSARAFKEELAEQLVTPLIKDPASVRTYSLEARSLNVETLPTRGVALGISPGSHGDYGIAIRIQQASLEEHPLIEDLRKKRGNEVDIQYIGRVHKMNSVPWYQREARPLKIGASISHRDVTAGTLGAFVTIGGEPHILSNNHVLADENAGDDGDPVVQPGTFDGGLPASHAVARLSYYINLLRGQPNYVDCAAALVLPGVDFDSTALTGIGSLSDVVAEADVGSAVEKIGRTTGWTEGWITAIELDFVWIDYELGEIRFDSQIEIEGHPLPFSRPGDSGSLIFTSEGYQPVGLLFAGSEQGGTANQGRTYANPISRALSDLSAILLT